MSIDWAVVGPVASWAGATIALVSLTGTTIWNAVQASTAHRQLANTTAQLAATLKANSVVNLWKFCESWDSAEMQQRRVRAAKALAAGVRPINDDVHDVLTFFERLGFLLHKGAIDADTAWSMFSDWALPYHKAAAYYIKVDQETRHGKTDRTIWECFGHLNERLLRIETTRRNKSEKDVEEGIDQKAFLDAEAELPLGQNYLSSPTSGGTFLSPAMPIPGGGATGRTFSAWRR